MRATGNGASAAMPAQQPSERSEAVPLATLTRLC